jgi:hypothetical protein
MVLERVGMGEPMIGESRILPILLISPAQLQQYSMQRDQVRMNSLQTLLLQDHDEFRDILIHFPQEILLSELQELLRGTVSIALGLCCDDWWMH